MSSTRETAPSVFALFPRSFWIVNAMEIFERMGWYGFYAVSTLYLTSPISEGGVGLSSQDRGVIQGLSTFFLYFFPVLFGTLADRYGYRLMFLLSSAIMIPGYLLLHLPHSFYGFFAVYILVACGHGMFKPVVVSTVVKTTNTQNGSMGFGIFYMMVNIGGLLGPIVAGIVRGWSWDYVFYASAFWIVLMGIFCFVLYEEPPHERVREPLSKVLSNMMAVVGNARFFSLIIGMLLLLVLGNKWWTIGRASFVAGVWLLFHAAWDVLLFFFGPKQDGRPLPFYLSRLKIGEGKYLLFLLLMSGFWTAFNQLQMTFPEYIRDYVDSTDLVNGIRPITSVFDRIFTFLGFDTTSWSKALLDRGQVKPEHLTNINALGIIFLQVLISFLARRMSPLVTIMSGTLLSAFSFLLFVPFASHGSGFLVVVGVLVFSVGEMLASPKAKEYAGRIAPPDKVGLYMGYFYMSIALGNLFGGLFSGTAYQHFGKRGSDRPDVLFLVIFGLCVLTALLLGLYDRYLKRQTQVSSRRVLAQDDLAS